MPAAGPSLSEKLRLIVEWSPAIALVTAVTAAPPGRDRVRAIMALLAFAARKTDVALDDDIIRLTEATLLTPEGGALVDYISHLVNGLVQQARYEQFGPTGS
jgi:hypothetical protein